MGGGLSARGLAWTAEGLALAGIVGGWTLMVWPLVTSNMLWGDEIYSFWIAGEPATSIVSITSGDVHPPLYYLLSRAVWLLRPHDEAIRVVSFAASAVTIALVWLAGRSAGGPRLGLAFALALACNGLHWRYAVEGRNYGLAGTFVAAMLVPLPALLRGVVRRHAPGRAGWGLMAAYGLAVLGGLFTHNVLQFTAFAISSVMGIAIAVERRWRWLYPYLAVHLLLAALYGPWFLVVQSQVTKMGKALEWIPAPIPQAMADPFAHYAPWGDETALSYQAMRWQFASLALFGGVCLGAAAAARRTNHALRWLAAAVLAMAIVPAMLAYAISAYHVRVLYPPRFSIFILVPFLGLVVAGLVRVRRRWLGLIGLGAWCGAMLFGARGLHERSMHGLLDRYLELAEAMMRPAESAYTTWEGDWDLYTVSHYAKAKLGARERLGQLSQLDLDLSKDETLTPPERVFVVDWSARHAHQSGTRGVHVFERLRLYAKRVRPILIDRRIAFTGEFAEEGGLFILEEIDWDGYLKERRDYLDYLSDLNAYPWEAWYGVDNRELRKGRGFTAVDPRAVHLSAYFEGGESEWRVRAERTVAAGDYAVVLSVYVIDSPKAPEALGLSLGVEGQACGTVRVPRGFWRLVFPVRRDEAGPLDWKLNAGYETWVPMKCGINKEDGRRLGPLFFWFGVVPVATLPPEGTVGWLWGK